MIHAILEILGVQRCQDVEEVLARWSLILWVLIGEVLLEMAVLLEHGVDVAHGQLLVVRHLDMHDLALLQEGLLAAEHVLEEVLVDDALVG